VLLYSCIECGTVSVPNADFKHLVVLAVRGEPGPSWQYARARQPATVPRLFCPDSDSARWGRRAGSIGVWSSRRGVWYVVSFGPAPAPAITRNSPASAPKPARRCRSRTWWTSARSRRANRRRPTRD